MVLKSFAKINLSLMVNKKLSNGLHNIQTMFCLINLFDEIHIKKLKKSNSDLISFKGQYSKFIKKRDNSVSRALQILRKKKLISHFYSIRVIKNIPVFAGLGGGSSNASTILRYLLKKKVDKNTQLKIMDNLGTDVRLFLHRLGFVKSLKKIEKINKKNKLYFLIIFPNIICSTKDIYSRVKKYSKKKSFSKNNFKSSKKIFDHIFKSKNDLQSIVEKRYPKIRQLLSNVRSQKGCYLSRMTGSGSACYGLFVNEKCSKVAHNLLKKKYPKFWFSIAKTI